MFFDILLSLDDSNHDSNQNLQLFFERTMHSLLTQQNTNWKLIIIGNMEQIQAVENSLNQLRNRQPIVNQIQFIRVKAYAKIDLNQAFKILESDLQPTQSHKLLFLESGDYLGPNFLKVAADFLQSLNLNHENLGSYLAFCDFKYLNSKDQVFESSFVLKTKLGEAQASDFIFRPKLLLRPVQLFWDLELIQKFGIRFDSELDDLDLKMAKFNLDYILTITKINHFLLPTPKLCPKIFYIASHQIVESFHTSQTNIWNQILKDKQEILQSIGGKTWLKYRWLRFWHR